MNTPRFIRQLIPDSSNAPAQKKIVFSSKENKEIIDSLIEDEMHISGMTGSQIIEGILINHYIPQTQCLAWIATLVHEDRDYGLYKAVSRLCIEIGSDPKKLKSSYDYSTVLNLTVDALSRCSFNYASDSYNNFAYYFDSVARMFDDNSSKSNTHLKDYFKDLNKMVAEKQAIPVAIIRSMLSEWAMVKTSDKSYYCLAFLYSSLKCATSIYPSERKNFVGSLFQIEKTWNDEDLAREEAKKQAEQDAQLTKYDIANGYVIVPSGWLLANPEDAINCCYVGVVEIKNGHLFNKPYGAPHILFFSEKPINEITPEDRNHLYQLCSSVWPEFVEVLEKEVKAKYDEDRHITNGEEWLKAPRPSIFPIREDTDFTYGDPPFGAKIVRRLHGR